MYILFAREIQIPSLHIKLQTSNLKLFGLSKKTMLFFLAKACGVKIRDWQVKIYGIVKLSRLCYNNSILL